MSHAIPPEVQAKIAEAVTWLWAQYGPKLVEKITQRGKNEVNWRWSIEKYYTSLYEKVGFVRILGRMEAEPLDNVFTHVNVLDKLSAERRYDIPRLMAEFSPRDFTWAERVKRVPGDEAVAKYPKLFIFGKPGAGKTTFLKHAALRAINHQIKKVPIFVTLKELSDSGMAIVPFIVHQFKVHQLPEPELFVEPLLKRGNAIVLFDGLDEVNLEDNKRADLIQALNDFVYQYGDCLIMLTCRVAATDYSFTQFTYVEMADFDKEQMSRYIDLWFVGDEVKRVNCRRALLEEKANRAVHELAQTPLLLSLLCLVYEERGEFPPNRDEIYDEATRALLIKWDSSRNIVRDLVYKQLSLKHKQNMLARIAAETFGESEYFLREKRVVDLIETYLQDVPGLEEPDGQLVLQAMEAQHGIFVERARRIHSFSHLTLQEYFTARYIVDNSKRGAIASLMRHVGDDRWGEVFKLTARMLDDATVFFELSLSAVLTLLNNDVQLLALLSLVQESVLQSGAYRPSAARAFLLSHIPVPAKEHISDDVYEYDPKVANDLARANDLANDLARANDLANDLALDLDLDLKDKRALISALDRVRVLDFADLDRARARARADLDRARADLDRARARADRVRPFGINLDRALARADDDLADDLARADDDLARADDDLANDLDHDRNLALRVAEKSGLTDFKAELSALSLPDRRGGLEVMQSFARELVSVLEKYENDWYPYRKLAVTNLFINLSEKQIQSWTQYLEANKLLLECLKLAYVPDRTAIEDQLLLPPS